MCEAGAHVEYLHAVMPKHYNLRTPPGGETSTRPVSPPVPDDRSAEDGAPEGLLGRTSRRWIRRLRGQDRVLPEEVGDHLLWQPIDHGVDVVDPGRSRGVRVDAVVDDQLGLDVGTVRIGAHHVDGSLVSQAGHLLAEERAELGRGVHGEPQVGPRRVAVTGLGASVVQVQELALVGCCHVQLPFGRVSVDPKIV